jgi:hypothetical protein
MESTDGKYGFDFSGRYTKIIDQKEINYELEDSRNVIIEFIRNDNKVIVRETFDADNQNSLELQKTGWQSILNNFKLVLESI